MRRRLAPRSALAVMGAAMLLAAAWAWVDPVFAGAPDENAHAAWVQHFAETGGFGGGTRPGYASSEQAAAQGTSESDIVTAVVGREPPRDAVTYRAWLAMPFSAAQRGDAAGPNPARNNPPLYYVVAAGPYRLGEGSDFFTRVLLARLLGVLFIAALVLAVWHLAGEVLGDGPGRVVATVVAGLMPMVGFVEGAVSPDALMYPLWAFVLLAGVRALRGEDRWILWLLLGTGAAVAIKYQSLTLLPGVLLVLAVAAYRHMTFVARRAARVALLAGALVVAAAAIAVGGRHGWLGQQVQDVFAGHANGQSLPTRLREFLSYVWQFYLPRPPFLTKFGIPANVGFWDTDFRQYTGAFGWHEVKLAEWVYVSAAVVVVALAAGAARAVAITGALRRHALVIVFFALVALSLFFSLHWTEYTMIKESGTPFLQGRYFVPLNPLFALVAGAAVGPGLARWARVQATAAGVLVAGLFLLNLLSFHAVLGRFYA